MALSDAAARREPETDLPRQANPSPENQDYLISRLSIPGFFSTTVTDAGTSSRALFAVPPSRRPGRNLDFAWQRSPFVVLENLAYPRDRASVSSPGIDLVLPTAALAKLRSGPGSPLAGPPPVSSPRHPRIALGSGQFLVQQTIDNLSAIIEIIKKALQTFNVLVIRHDTPSFLQTRLRDFTQTPGGSQALQNLISANYSSSNLDASTLGVLMADAVFLLDGNEYCAEGAMLQAFAPTLRAVWGQASPVFDAADDTSSPLTHYLLGRPVGHVFPDQTAQALALELRASGVLSDISAELNCFADPESSLGSALRQILQVGSDR